MKIPALHRLYRWTISHAEGPHATWALFGISFAESSFFPLPPDLLLVPMILADRRKAWWYAFICTVASVLGGLLGYAIGAFMFHTVGMWLMNVYGMEQGIDDFRAMYQQYGAAIILLKGLTPIPYKIVTIASGLAGYSLFWFVVFSCITRGVRFFVLSALLYYYGQPIRHFIEKRLELVMLILLGVIVGGFLLLRLF